MRNNITEKIEKIISGTVTAPKNLPYGTLVPES